MAKAPARQLTARTKPTAAMMARVRIMGAISFLS